MSEQHSTISRRSALRTSLSAILATGATSALSGAVRAQEPGTAPQAAPVVVDPEVLAAQFAAWDDEWERLHQETMDEYVELGRRVRERFGEEARHLMEIWFDAGRRLDSIEHQRDVELTFLHFPGIVPALRAVYEHALEGRDDTCSTGIAPW